MEAVKDMALPDALAFAWAYKSALNSGTYQELGKCPNLSFSLWKVAAD